MCNKFLWLILLLAFPFGGSAQLLQNKTVFTHADTLRGSDNAQRNWWNVLHYSITVNPDFESKTIQGKTTIQYAVVKPVTTMQIDLQQPLIVDSIFFHNKNWEFKREDNVVYLEKLPVAKIGSHDSITIFYHGKPREAVRPPWDGGWIWKKDSLNRPWMTVACQGLGASVWYPCKDYQGDEPDNGATLSIISPDTLMAVGNGRLKEVVNTNNQKKIYTWQVVNPINNYDIIPYIGKYVNKKDTLLGAKGLLNLQFWVLDYDTTIAWQQFQQVKPMLRAFEYWFGPYPFYEDGYQLIQAPHLGMEHQSAVAYGNHFKNGYLGRDLSGTGWGLRWDFIIVHESGHEWFGNNITTKDVADMWVHEGFTNYSETLFTEYYYGKEAGTDYNVGSRKNILNDKPIIGPYGVNKEGSSDMYYKGGALLHSIRHSMNNDVLFRKILHGLNKEFYHKTVTTANIENYINQHAGFNFQYVFNQYLRTTQIPVLEYAIDSAEHKVRFRWINCIPKFNLPISLWDDSGVSIKIYPTTSWKLITVSSKQMHLFNDALIQRLYYVKTKKS
ncbi:M1 family metallopeptidase [Hydrotalea sandarakina]|jgi:aminopeptidase N|uniref:Peptidase M1-like protein n=1 Tax=Hydrotalea sandarakina TaxID=1004304 RepID=A0A2W7TRZ6_9BACT|nr:M1 family metallopeptidase [Hydrotalea sandarakina]PZX65882.1 peptidase M1-like protein [Hydrotalea sandarakina]